MPGSASITFSEVEQVANALGLHLDPTRTRFDLGGSDKSVPRNAVIHSALSPLFRQVVQQYIAPGQKGADVKQAMERLEAEFATLFKQKLAPARGAPSLFRKTCEALEIGESDAEWILHLLITSLLQGVIRHYADHLSAPETKLPGDQDPGDREEGEESEEGERDEGIGLGAMAIEMASAGLRFSQPHAKTSTTAWNPAAPVVAATKWQSHQRAVKHIWENLSLALLLRRGDAFTSNWVQDALKRSSGRAKGRRYQALEKAKQAQAAIEGVIAGSQLPQDDQKEDGADVTRRGAEFAALLLAMVIEVFAGRREPPITLTRNEGRDVRRLRPSDALVRALTRISHSVRLTEPAGPVFARPRHWTMRGQDASGLTQGGSPQKPLDFYKFNVKNRPIRAFLQHMSDDHAAYDPFFQAVNALQDTGWRINKRVWQVQQALIKASDDPDVLVTGLGESFDEIALPTSTASNWKPWLEGVFFARADASEKARKKNRRGAKNPASPGWRLVSPAGAPEVMRLALKANFHFTYNIDSRGRIYPIGGYIHPQSEDTFRALLEFGSEEPITEKGVHWLALHGSQCVSRTRILADLGVTARSSPTIDERVAWVIKMTGLIQESAQEPLECTWWRDAGGKSAFQFLAFCFAWDAYKRDGPLAKCRLPIHVDGTCNGLQHIAALTADETLARAVNLVPGPPEDIYMQVARLVEARASDTQRRLMYAAPSVRSRFDSALDSALQRHEESMRASIKARPALIGRDAAKSVVMVIPYGAGVSTYARELAEAITQKVKADPKLFSLLELWGEAMVEELAAGAEHNQEIKDPSGKVAEVLPKVARDESWKRLYYGKLLLATLLAREFQGVLDEQFPVIRQFKGWLHDLTKVVTNRDKPMVWVSPAGLPILQNGFKTHVDRIDIKGVQRIRLSHYVLKDDVSARRQLLGILPNFIHSLDSSHLVATVLKSRANGVRSFSMIHDSFGTHAAHMPVLAEKLREAFTELYAVDRLEELREFIARLLEDKPLPRSGDPREITKGRLIAWSNSNRNMGVISPIGVFPPFAKPDSTSSVADVKGSLYFFC